MTTFAMESFAMECPVCGSDVYNIKATVTNGERTEHLWGAPVSVDESECEIDSIPECPGCGQKTIEPDEAAEFYWDQVYG